MWRTTETYCVWLPLVGCETQDCVWNIVSLSFPQHSYQSLIFCLAAGIRAYCRYGVGGEVAASPSITWRVSDRLCRTVCQQTHMWSLFSLWRGKNRGIVQDTCCTSSQFPWASLQEISFFVLKPASGHVKPQITAFEKSAQRIADPPGVRCCIRK